jgi:NAD(P)-dependent dehydrogenase (short-subunit alcohol dehydrogenase family)
VNNAAVFDIAPATHITEERVFDINMKGTLLMMRAASNRMIERGRGGKIINMARQAGRRGDALVILYCATRAAIKSATQSAGLALIKYDITSTRSPPEWRTVSTGTGSMRNSLIGRSVL